MIEFALESPDSHQSAINRWALTLVAGKCGAEATTCLCEQGHNMVTLSCLLMWDTQLDSSNYTDYYFELQQGLNAPNLVELPSGIVPGTEQRVVSYRLTKSLMWHRREHIYLFYGNHGGHQSIRIDILPANAFSSVFYTDDTMANEVRDAITQGHRLVALDHLDRS